LGYRSGGDDYNGAYLKDEFRECHNDERQRLNSGDSYIYFSEDGHSWDVVGCFHRVWSLWGSHTEKEKATAKGLLTESRSCKYYFAYHSGYEPASHKELKRDKEKHTMMVIIGILGAIAVIVAAIITAIARG
jgi:hypothetical protein